MVAGDEGFFKPDPRPFRRLLELLEAEASEALFVGDSLEHDIAGARGVGMRTVWVRPDGAEEDLTLDPTPKPDCIIDHVVALREILL